MQKSELGESISKGFKIDFALGNSEIGIMEQLEHEHALKGKVQKSRFLTVLLQLLRLSWGVRSTLAAPARREVTPEIPPTST